MSDLLAFDRASVRRKDANGFLHVALSNISKATVDPYFGHEIPGGETLGLIPDKVYWLLRDPDELARGAETFNNLPILDRHVPISAELPERDEWIGSTGTDAQFNAPYLQNSSVIWLQSAIHDIETETKREWSCAYRYRADMTPGEYLGLRFDGVMRDIVGNHVALVEVGRAGPDVIVGDSLGKHDMAKKTLLTTAAAIITMVKPKLAMDEALEVDDVVKILEENPALLAHDAEPDKPAEDMDEAEDEEETAEDEEADVAEDEEDDDMAQDANAVDKPAMDAAIKKASTAARADAVRDMNRVREAERIVRPLVGELSLALDSAEDIYAFALDEANIPRKGVHPSAYRSLVEMHISQLGDKPAPKVAMDANAASNFNERFPTAATLVRC